MQVDYLATCTHDDVDGKERGPVLVDPSRQPQPFGPLDLQAGQIDDDLLDGEEQRGVPGTANGAFVK